MNNGSGQIQASISLSTEELKRGVAESKELLAALPRAMQEQAQKVENFHEQMVVGAKNAGKSLRDFTLDFMSNQREMTNETRRLSAEVDKSTSSIAASIKRASNEQGRALAELQAGSKNTADYFRKLGEIRGVDMSKLDPFINGLEKMQNAIDIAQAKQREFADNKAFEKKAEEARILNKASEYVYFWESALTKAEAAEKEFAAVASFEKKHQDAKKFVRDAEYVRFWASELEKVDSAESKLASNNSFIDKLRKESEAIGKTRADLLEMQAAQMGLTKETAPYIAKLREQETGIRNSGKALNEFGMTAKASAAALRQVPAQFTDIVVSLQGGQAPLTVLLQQGGQLKDVFGSAGAAAQALGGYIAGLVNPFTLAAAAIGTLAYGYLKGREEAEAFQKTLILTGNAAGVTAGQLSTIAASLDAGSTTQAKASEVLNMFAQTGKVGAENFARFTKAAIDFEKAGGGAVEDTVKAFESLGRAPLQASLKLTESSNYLTRSVYAQIKALEEQGKTSEATRVAQEAYAASLEGMTPKLLENLGLVERAWLAIKGAVKQTGDAILDVGREGQEVTLNEMKRRLAQAQESASVMGMQGYSDEQKQRFNDGITNLKIEISLLQQTIDLEKQKGKAQKETNETNKAAIALGEQAKSFYSDEKKREIERDQAAANRDKALASLTEGSKAYNEVLRDYQLVIAGINRGAGKEYADSINNQISSVEARIKSEKEMLSRLQERGKFAEKVTDGEREAARVSEQISNARNAGEVALLRKLQGEYIALGEVQKKIQAETVTAGAQEALSSAKETAKVYENELQLSGLTAIERQKILAIRAVDLKYAKQIREIEQKSLNDDERRANLKIIDEVKTIEKSAAVNKVIQDDFAKTSEQINQSLTDALMRGFENGKNFGTNFKDTLENMFKTMILRPTISAIIAPVGGGIMSLFSAGAQAAGGSAATASSSSLSFANGVSTYQMLSGIKTVLTDGVASAVAQGFGAVASTSAGQSMGLATQAAGPATASGQGSYALTQSGLATQQALTIAGNAIAAYAVQKTISGDYKIGDGKLVDIATVVGSYFVGPLSGVIAGIANRAFGMGSVNTTGQGISGTFSSQAGADVQNFQEWFQKGGWFRSNKSGTNYSAVNSELDMFLDTSIKNVAESTREYARSIGIGTSMIDGFSKSIKISLRGLDAAAQGKAIEDAIGSFAEDLAKSVVNSAQTVFIDGWSVPIAKEGETATQTLMRLSESLGLVNSSLKLMGDNLLAISVTSSVAASSLIDLFGGVENFRNQTSAYYEAFFSDIEKNAQVAKSLKEGFSSLNLALPETIAQYKQLVNSQDLLTASGQKTYAALISLSPAFASIVKSTEELKAGYQQAVLTSAEMQALNIESIRTQFMAVGVKSGDIPKSIADLRSLVDAQDESTEAGKSLKMALMALAPAFVSTLPALEQSQQAILDAEKAAQDKIKSERQSLEKQLLTATGNTAEIRRLELESLDASNRSLQERIWALEDEKKAQQELIQASQGVTSEIDRLKKSLGGSTDAQSAAALQAQFATTTAQARSGDLTALSKLPTISSALDQAFQLTATTASEVARMKGFLAGSLAETLSVLGAGSAEKAISTIASVDLTATQQTDGLELTPTSTTAGLMSGASSTAVLIEEISALRVDNQAQARAIVQLQSRLTKVVERWDLDGIPETRAVV
jgi:hypothetical protein